MLYELLTGDLAFVAGDPIAVISQHLHAPVVPPRAKRPGIPPGLDALVVRLLSKQPQDRPTSAAEVQASLARLAAGETVEAVPGVAGQRHCWTASCAPAGGREQELAEVRALWKRAWREGQVLLISGEPGIRQGPAWCASC